MVFFVKQSLLFLEKKSICLVSLDSIYSRFAPIRYIRILQNTFRKTANSICSRFARTRLIKSLLGFISTRRAMRCATYGKAS